MILWFSLTNLNIIAAIMISLARLQSLHQNQLMRVHNPEENDMKSTKLLATSILLFSAASMAGEAGKKCDVKNHATSWGEPGQMGGAHVRHLGKALKLTDAQKETLKAQREADKPARDALHTKLKAAREALAAAVDAGANEAELNALSETLGKLHAEQALAGAKAKKAFLAVLTEEQKQTMAELKVKRLERKMERKEKRESAKS
jgi:periplasmic protein CpxP/Spy